MNSLFRFENLEIWKDAMQISNKLFDIADDLSNRNKFRMSEQLYGATLSITNNIAEGSGSFSDKDFANFINISRRSLFECANIVFIIETIGYIKNELKQELLVNLAELSKKLTNFRQVLLKSIDAKNR